MIVKYPKEKSKLRFRDLQYGDCFMDNRTGEYYLLVATEDNVPMSLSLGPKIKKGILHFFPMDMVVVSTALTILLGEQ